jgi:hypothetical protein
MANEVEIDRPLPGDTLGRVVDVGGTYSLDAFFAVSVIVVKFLKPDGTPAQRANGSPVAPVSTGPLAAGTNQPWSVTFNLDMDYANHKFHADLLTDSSVLDSDEVEDLDVHLNAVANIIVTTV